MCEKNSKTRTCPSQAKNVPTCQKSAVGVFQFLQSILNIQTYIYIRVFHFYTFVQFRLALCVSWLQHSMYATTKNISVLAYVEVPVTGHGVLDGKLH